MLDDDHDDQLDGLEDWLDSEDPVEDTEILDDDCSEAVELDRDDGELSLETLETEL